VKEWNALPAREVIDRTMKALEANGIEPFLAAGAEEARRTALSFVPAGAEVFTMTSITLEEIGVTAEVNESGRYDSVRVRLGKLDPKTHAREQRKLGAAPDYALGSVHALTETGTLVVASRTGSQLPAYAYGAGTLIWVVGAQKIVKDVDEGMRRLNEYVIDRESARCVRVYGLPPDFRTFPSRILLFNREFAKGRVKVILVNQALGF
jgi:hypothetical protein